MRGSELPQSRGVGLAARDHVPSWAFVLSALLLAVLCSRRSGAATSAGVATDEDPEDSTRGDHREREIERGRTAETPSQIPARGRKDILLRVYRSIMKDRILLIAAGVTFYTLLAIFPGIAALISIFGLFADPVTIAEHLDSIVGVLPGGAIDVLRDQMTRLASQRRTALGIGFVVSLAFSIWTANSGVKALFDALNFVYEEEETRGFLKLTRVTLLVTLGIIAFVLLTLGVVVALPIVLHYVSQSGVSSFLVNFGRWPVLFVLITLALQFLYRYGPSRKEPQWRWISWGSVIAAIMWLAASVLFSWYVANFGSYNKTYGSLGAIIGFMTWIWISIIVVLVGAKVNAEMEHQTVRETTIGQAKPLGTRGARMADTVGAAQG
jgi:membrane protein